MKNRNWLGVVMVLAATPAFAQQPDVRREPRVLTVSGTGIVQRQPDRAVIMVAVESRAPTAQQAAQANASKMDAVFAALRKVGIVPPKVQTVSYGLQPEYGQPDPKSPYQNVPRIIGYVANNMVRVQVDSIARAGSVIDATVASGANRIENLSFELRDAEAARLDALRAAVERARAEAEVLAAAAGQKLGPPLSISSSSGWQPREMYRRDVMLSAARSPETPTPIEAGNLTVTGTVNITYLLEDR